MNKGTFLKKLLGIMFLSFIVLSCKTKKQEEAAPDFSRMEKLDHAVTFNNETIPMAVYYSCAADGEYFMRVLVFEYDGKKHTINLDDLENNTFDAPDHFGLIDAADYNFDNYMDIAFLSGRGANQSFYQNYIYNPQEQKYYHHAELDEWPDIWTDSETQTIRSHGKSGHAGLLYTYGELKWENGQFTLIYRTNQDYDEDSGLYILTTETLENGVWKKQTQMFKYDDEEDSFEEIEGSLIETEFCSGSSLYFIRSSEDFENDNAAMEKLGMDANPYTAIEKVGWSRKGLFAYRCKCLLDSGEMWGWIYSLTIINAVTDEIIEEDSIKIGIEGDSIIIGEEYYPKEKLGDLSKEYKTKWNKILEKHNITGKVDDPVSENFQMDYLEFPINNFNCRFDYQIERETIFDEDWDTDITRDDVNWKLIIGNNTIQKVIVEKSEGYGIPFFGNISGRKILGYYKSPYENRIAVVTTNYSWVSYSGGYYTVGLDLFGCNMNVGLSQ